MSVVQININGRRLYIASVYIEPNSDEDNTLQRLDNFLKMTCNNHQLVGGDFNGWHPIWGSDRSNSRGNKIVNIAYGNNMFLCNKGDTPTFETISHGQIRHSFIDLTMASSTIYDQVLDWRVDIDICPSSQHRAIVFSICTLRRRSNSGKSTTTFRYNTKRVNWDELRSPFISMIEERLPRNVVIESLDEIELEKYINHITSIIQTICDKLISKSNAQNYRCPWWTEELEKLKKDVIRNHHQIQKLIRQKRPIESVLEEKTRLKEAYSKAFRETSTRHFRDFCEKQGKEDVWSVTNKIIKSGPPIQPPVTLKRSNGTFTTTSSETAQELLNQFYPDEDLNDTPQHTEMRNFSLAMPDTPNEPLFEFEQIISCLNSINPKKAPGTDHLTADICLLFANSFPHLITSVMNQCLRLGYFPEIWKQAFIKIIPKPNKEIYTDVSSFRPIGLINVFAKLLEKLITPSIWQSALKYTCVINKLLTLQRGFAINIIRGFRTVSTVTSISLAQLSPLPAKIAEMADNELTRISRKSQYLPNDITLDTPAEPEKLLHPSLRKSIKYCEESSLNDIENIESQNGYRIFTDGSKHDEKLQVYIFNL
ncbi:unnamed protein product [Parnassius apollo]|uniref:(apollo) hypothetical protein n=1 Tax=Parnassius apollo TaxID=110799 RepID=A0A8S3W107_PARAO|nr:unnamed protein product [Parnassius apollo]